MKAGDFSLLDYENESLEPWAQTLENQDSRETLPSLRRVERSQVSASSFPMAASRARRRTGLLEQRMALNAIGRPGRESYQSNYNWEEEERSEAEQEFEDLNDRIFMFPASYLVPDSLVRYYVITILYFFIHFLFVFIFKYSIDSIF